jgi:hypothetical protein
VTSSPAPKISFPLSQENVEVEIIKEETRDV